jgi:lipid II:glycine glycyltransferase (peptidoglycan interpeptide bridge formation enzyme)
MDLRNFSQNQKEEYNKAVNHVIQSWEWGEFKALNGPILRYGLYHKNKLKTAFTITLHKIPLSSQYVGYLPKGPLPDKELAEALEKIGKEHNCAFIKLEPNIQTDQALNYSVDPRFSLSLKSLFTKYNFLLDLTPPEEDLLKAMHPKTRYNIRLAQKRGIKVKVHTDQKGFEAYLKLYFDTTRRQSYQGHTPQYHKKVWELMRKADMARIVIGYYQNQPLSAWMLFNFKDTLYYPYGGSSDQHREVMANNLVAWEAIKLGKSLGLKSFDMWGAAHSPDPDQSDPYFGFHNFKKGYGAKLVEYLGTYDLVFNDPLYWMFTVVDKLTPLKLLLLKVVGR